MAFFWTFLNFMIDIFSGGFFGFLLAFVCAFAGICYSLSIIRDYIVK